MSNPFDHTITFGEDYYDFDGDQLWADHGPPGFAHNGSIEIELEKST